MAATRQYELATTGQVKTRTYTVVSGEFLAARNNRLRTQIVTLLTTLIDQQNDK